MGIEEGVSMHSYVLLLFYKCNYYVVINVFVINEIIEGGTTHPLKPHDAFIFN